MAKARSKARRRMPGRNAKGRFVKRHAGKRAHARRSRPARRRVRHVARARRAAPVRRRHSHRRRGRFVSLTRARYTPKYVMRARRRKSKTGKHLRAVGSIGKGGRVAGLVRLNPSEMAAMMGNPRRRRKARRHLAVNVRRRKHHRRHVRRNPSFGGIVGVVKASVPMVLGGLGGGLLSGLADASVLAEKPLALRLAVKGAAAIAAEGFLRRKHPRLAAGLSGGLFGSVGYDLGLTSGGGMVAHNPRDAIKKTAYAALNDPEMAAMMGDVGDDETLADIANGEYDEHLADIVDQA